MNGRLFYVPITVLFMAVLALLAFLVVSVLFVGALQTAFLRLGFAWHDALLLLLASLVGSSINIPFREMKSEMPLTRTAYVRVFGVNYRIPIYETVYNSTTVALNVGGALIPILVSAYLLMMFSHALAYAVAATVIVTIAVHRIARPVPGLGIVTPALLPPLIAALSSLAVIIIAGGPRELEFVVAYVSGTLGTLIGADILNLNRIQGLGAPVVSIGGAGTFDGVFLTGLIAVLLV
ncbi:MAG: DUF1614 domain-containing protein [Methanothrix sp.]|jgi:Predicted membrane protein|uniref:DUF1614 domain-containing protein n=1 Tax=Methanothrix thermoacetophila (strain DSM 6194 / JCM 14653 / NBRC 101360 / PT) TaxID=349307 RepID=A0B772_METTP|nr:MULTISPECIES: DUF1614 domain-containing protein [Methanothrix]ABK14546.1 protein of unknown function DUF1614 [Methanothrix thermoacetophila PT]MBC7079454.1 DUF1614 domain-containing protein [Methanothrix sp.]NPU87429.1 DUF1614 domain-containing protein [Methanothrix sp.]